MHFVWQHPHFFGSGICTVNGLVSGMFYLLKVGWRQNPALPFDAARPRDAAPAPRSIGLILDGVDGLDDEPARIPSVLASVHHKFQLPPELHPLDMAQVRN